MEDEFVATMFEQLMKGLDEVEAYLEGEREGYYCAGFVERDNRKSNNNGKGEMRGFFVPLKMTASEPEAVIQIEKVRAVWVV